MGFVDGEPDDDLLRRMSAPENEVPVALPANRVLARTDDVAAALVGLHVYTTGVSFDLALRVRAAAAPSLRVGLNDLLWDSGRRGRLGFLFGLELADGRRVGNVPERAGTDGVLFHQGGGGGGDTAVDQSWWLSPVPPAGPLRVVVRCDELGLAETVTELDGTAIRRAADEVLTLWPWEPPRDERPAEPPPPLDLPPDSWFAARG
ncbi:hypothetical protein OF117_17495 [Geodermatophilus sp. YIM 151500]|uniref:hypothetical protein n=1 Tax=Geodermatophilus sp. YIM 151500 TaxID=2984531 RepID=UPI0021E44CA3|nr:hypothetical protein [Geodermatophilus sp. YIM 151500]MCV2491146.1 hypothetical protein [Geodermatophilus sp. YIM 151500]